MASAVPSNGQHGHTQTGTPPPSPAVNALTRPARRTSSANDIHDSHTKLDRYRALRRLLGGKFGTVLLCKDTEAGADAPLVILKKIFGEDTCNGNIEPMFAS